MADKDPALHRPRRWLVLLAYSLVVGVSQMLWLNFGPLLTLIQTRYGVSELLASSLLLVFPLLYVFFSIPAGWLTDKCGYRFAVGAGAILMAIFSCVRIFDSSFWLLLAGQIGIAVAQPYVVNGISKLVTDWFSEEQGAIATGLGTMGMFVGMALGMAVTPALVNAIELRWTMVFFAGISIAVAIFFLVVVHPNGDNRSNATAATTATGFGPLLRNGRLLLLCVVSFLGLGVFNGLTTWLEQILAPHHIDSEQAGLIGGALIIGGIVGAAIIPALSDAYKRRKPFLIACVAGALLSIYPLCTNQRFLILAILGFVHGFCFLPTFALVLEMCAQIAGAASAGAATSLLTLAGNAGGVVVIVAMPIVKGQGADYFRAVVLMVVLLAITALLALVAPETFVHRSAPAEAQRDTA